MREAVQTWQLKVQRHHESAVHFGKGLRILSSMTSSGLRRQITPENEVSDYSWVTSGDKNLQHCKKIASGGIGEVHEVLPCKIFSAKQD